MSQRKIRPLRVILPSNNPQQGDYDPAITDIYTILRKLEQHKIGDENIVLSGATSGDALVTNDGIVFVPQKFVPFSWGVGTNLTVSGSANISGSVNVNTNLFVTGNSLVVGNSSISGNISVVGNSSVSGNSLVVGNFNLSGSAFIKTNLTISGSTTLSGFTSGGVLFVGPSGVVTEDTINFFWDDTDNRLVLSATPPLSDTKAILRLGNALVGASANGTYIGINSPSGYTGRFGEFQVDSVPKWRLHSNGTQTVGSRLMSNDFPPVAFGVDVDSNGPNVEYLTLLYDDSLPTDNGTFKGVYFGLGQGTQISLGFGEIGAIDENTTKLPMIQFQRNGATARRTVFYGTGLSMATNGAFLFLARTDTGVVNALTLDPSNTLVMSSEYTGGTSMGITFNIDSSSGMFKWTNYFQLTEMMRLTGTGLLTLTTLDAATNTVTVGTTLKHNSSGTPAVGFGNEIRFQLKTSTTVDKDAGGISYEWEVATEGSQISLGRLTAYYTTTAREVMQWGATSSKPKIGFLGAPAAIQQTGGSATAGALYTGTEQAMLQAAYDCLRTFGYLS